MANESRRLSIDLAADRFLEYIAGVPVSQINLDYEIPRWSFVAGNSPFLVEDAEDLTAKVLEKLAARK